jgi:hypothetical protein
METRMRIPLVVFVALVVSACTGVAPKPKPVAQTTPPVAETAPFDYVRPCADTPASAAGAFDCDRRSILAMAGEFRVRFAFEETAALAPGYTPHAEQRSGGTELVQVIADTGTSISLQHILVLGNEHSVVKHWRQDWHYEPMHVIRFRGNGRFDTEKVDPVIARGAWSQTVYEVDDAPRYGGIGRWTHAEGQDAWQSDRIRRPLPRREYTRRSDYQVLDVVNRHALTPAGWIHEQDNTKLVLAADGKATALVREQGLNTYTRIAGVDFSAGRDYWKRTAAFWTDVRAEWLRRATEHPDFVTSPEPNGEPRIDVVFALAERAAKGERISVAEIRGALDPYVSAPVPK